MQQSSPPNSDLDLDLSADIAHLLLAMNCTDQALKACQKISKPLAEKHTPRKRFERWRNSEDGKQWKMHQHQQQNGRCAVCRSKILLKGSHIDHIKPLSRSPELACEPSNLQILCAGCNQRKSNQ